MREGIHGRRQTCEKRDIGEDRHDGRQTWEMTDRELVMPGRRQKWE